MSGNRIHASHPSFNESLLSASPERAVAAFVACGDLSVDETGRVWRHRRKVGGKGPKLVDVVPAVRAENILPSGRHQIQVYINGTRVLCLAARLVWFLQSGEIPDGFHIHHRNEDPQDNRIENLRCLCGSEHIAQHGIGREPPNKGTKYGETEAYKKALTARKRNYAEQCKRTYELWRSGLRASAISKIQGVCTRQIYSRLRSHAANSHF